MSEPLYFEGPFAPEELVKRAIINTAWRSSRRRQSQLCWVIAHDLFGLGSTSSVRLCERVGINPFAEAQDILPH
jgi:hypothetical protein